MDLIDGFCHDYHAIRDTTLPRRREQEKALRQFEDSLGGRSLLEAGPADFEAFMVAGLERGLHKNTVRKTLRMVKPFYGWCWDRDLIDGDRLLRIQRVRPPLGSTGQSQPKPYNRRELDRFYAELGVRWPHAKPSTVERWQQGRAHYRRVWKHGMRLQIDAIVAFALYEGMRSKEIYQGSMDDLHPLNRHVIVREGVRKGDGKPKYREVPMQERTREAMAAWLEWRALLQPDHDFTWLCLHPRWALRPMNRTRFGGLMRTVGQWELHRLRHTCGTEWLRAGMPLKYVSEYLGHHSIRQTEAYTKVVPEDLEAASVRAFSKFDDAVAPRKREDTQ